MNYPTTEGKNGLIYHVAEGVKVIPTSKGYWTLDAYQKGERLRRNFEKGEEGLKKALRTGELYAAKLGLKKKQVEEKFLCLSDVAEQWLTGNRSRWTPSTFERYSGLVRDFVNPKLGATPLEKLNRLAIKDFLVETLMIRSARTVELMHAVMSGIYHEAIERGYVEENPCHGLLRRILPPKHKRNQTLPDPFGRDDLDLLLEAAKLHLPEPLPMVIETLALTGMRLGECLAMRWNQFEGANHQYMITQTVRNGRFGLPKTGARLIDLPVSLSSKLERHIKELRKEALREGRELSYLFPGVTQRTVQMGLKRACRLARLRVRNPHDLRHTYASLLLMDGISPAYVQKQLGHHSITMTVDIYGHWIPGEGKSKEELNRVFEEKEPLTLRLTTSVLDRKRRSSEFVANSK